jgi:hypothetical protein
MASGTPVSGQVRPRRRATWPGPPSCRKGADVGLAVPEDMHGQPLPHETGRAPAPEVPAGSGPLGAFAAGDNQRPRGRECQLQTGVGHPRCHRGRERPAPGADPGVRQRPLAAAWYCATTPAGMRPRPLTAMPCWPAHARISPARSRPGAARADARPMGPPTRSPAHPVAPTSPPWSASTKKAASAPSAPGPPQPPCPRRWPPTAAPIKSRAQARSPSSPAEPRLSARIPAGQASQQTHCPSGRPSRAKRQNVRPTDTPPLPGRTNIEAARFLAPGSASRPCPTGRTWG